MRPIIVAGPARAGTSLIADAISRHPDIGCSLREGHFLDRIPIWTKRSLSNEVVRESVDRKVARALGRIANRDHLAGGEGGLGSAMERFIASRKSSDAWELYRRVLAILTQHAEPSPEPYACAPPAVIDKTNSWWTIRDAWAEVPGARILIVLRDPRDLALTHARLVQDVEGRGRVDALVRSALYWRRFARLGQWLVGRDPQRCQVVRYEDFVQSQPQTILAAFRTLGLSKLSAAQALSLLAEASGHTSYDPAMGQPGLSSNAIGRWRRTDSAEEVALVEALSCAAPGSGDHYAQEFPFSVRAWAQRALLGSPTRGPRVLGDLLLPEQWFAGLLRALEPSDWREPVAHP